MQRFAATHWDAMFRNLLNLAVFFTGLVAVCWIGAGYVGSNPLATAVTMVIGACYLAGALELHRYRQATSTLAHAVTDLSAAPTSLDDWLGRLHPSLRNATRLRIEGERVALPLPALTPYLVGLLVLLGMLGTPGALPWPWPLAPMACPAAPPAAASPAPSAAAAAEAALRKAAAYST